MNKFTMLLAAPVIVMLCMGDSCEVQQTGADKEAQQTRQGQAQAANVVGYPAVINWSEKRELKMLYELRDNPHLQTYTYRVDLNGKRHPVCPTVSFGYPLPYATQYTAADSMQRWSTQTEHTSTDYARLPQPEPNGLYPPASADGTWVMCLNPDGKSINPVYVEPQVEAYPWEMPHVTD